MPYFLFTLLGFVLGSTLFAYWIPKLLKKIDICTLPDDHNPGVSNAFMYGGFLCGILSLICELAKGFIPVYLGQKCLDINSLLFVPVLVAPVFGHAFPFLQKHLRSTQKIYPRFIKRNLLFNSDSHKIRFSSFALKNHMIIL